MRIIDGNKTYSLKVIRALVQYGKELDCHKINPQCPAPDLYKLWEQVNSEMEDGYEMTDALAYLYRNEN